MKSFLSQELSESEAYRLAGLAADEVTQLGGTVNVVRGLSRQADTYADAFFLWIDLPEDVTKLPEEIAGGGVTFSKGVVMEVPAMPDQHINLDTDE